jgi:hypothetical protein
MGGVEVGVGVDNIGVGVGGFGVGGGGDGGFGVGVTGLRVGAIVGPQFDRPVQYCLAYEDQISDDLHVVRPPSLRESPS